MEKFISQSKCSPGANGSKKTCFSLESLKKIARELNKGLKGKNKIRIGQKKDKLWDSIRTTLSNKCNGDETCWLKHKKVKHVTDSEMKHHTFKPEMPNEWKNNKYAWLSTVDILKVMKQAERVHPDFKFMGPVPSDCPTSINCELSSLDPHALKRKGINKIGIVYNLDVSTGPGTHWTAVFITLPKKQIDYFDSYGSKPQKNIRDFIKQLVLKYRKNNEEPTLVYGDKRHQYGGSECGMYSMYFILKRLTGTSMYQFNKNKITDKKMNDLRKILYRT